MWNTYEPPSEEQPDEPLPEGSQRPPASWPRLPDAPSQGPRPLSPQPHPRTYRGASGHRVATGSRGSTSAGALLGLGAAIASVAIGIGTAGLASGGPSQEQLEREAWDECIAEYDGRDSGLLSPADLCEIGHERPEGYVDQQDEGSIFDDDCDYTYLECDDSFLDDTYP